MEPVLTILLISLFVLLLNLFIFRFVVLSQQRQRQHAEEKARIETQFQQELLRTQLEIQEQTLRSVSQEIHDNVGQTLSLVKLNLFTLYDGDPPKPEEKIAASKTQLTRAMEDLRQLSRSLHGDKLTDIGIAAALRNELDMLEKTGLYQTRLSSTGIAAPLNPQKEVVLFRMAQEALHNAVRHAAAKTISITLAYSPGQLVLTLTDDGKGFSTAGLNLSQTGIGLKTMANRAALIGAAIDFDTAPGKGCTIRVKLPLQDNGM